MLFNSTWVRRENSVNVVCIYMTNTDLRYMKRRIQAVKRKWCDQGTDGWHGGCRSESIIVYAVLLLNYRVLVLSNNNLLSLPVLLHIILLQPIQQRPDPYVCGKVAVGGEGHWADKMRTVYCGTCDNMHSVLGVKLSLCSIIQHAHMRVCVCVCSCNCSFTPQPL